MRIQWLNIANIIRTVHTNKHTYIHTYMYIQLKTT